MNGIGKFWWALHRAASAQECGVNLWIWHVIQHVEEKSFYHNRVNVKLWTSSCVFVFRFSLFKRITLNRAAGVMRLCAKTQDSSYSNSLWISTCVSKVSFPREVVTRNDEPGLRFFWGENIQFLFFFSKKNNLAALWLIIAATRWQLDWKQSTGNNIMLPLWIQEWASVAVILTLWEPFGDFKSWLDYWGCTEKKGHHQKCKSEANCLGKMIVANTQSHITPGLLNVWGSCWTFKIRIR